MSSNTTSGYGSEEPQCYNCGALGHWAVACPEPTRQTPAGLAAWRNSSNARPGSGNGGNRDRRGPPKKHKGPIITKYGPPPGPHPQPPLPPVSSYPPSSAAYHAHAPYPPAGPPPAPGPPNYHHYPPPPPGYPPAQPTPDYPPPHRVDSHYPPTPPGPPQGYPRLPTYGYDTQHMHGYPNQPPPPPPSSHYGPSPPGYHTYPERDPEPQSYPPPSLPPPSYGSPPLIDSYGRSRSHSHGHPSEPTPRPYRSNHHGERNRGPPTHTASAKRNTGSQNRSSSRGSGPIQLPTPLIHSLPPKPPQSRNTQPEEQRGKHNKRNQDRKNRQRRPKQRDGNKNKDGERKGQEASPARDVADRSPSRRSNASVDTQARATTQSAATQSLPAEQPNPQTASTSSITPQKGTSSDQVTEDTHQPELKNDKQASPGLIESSDSEDDPWEWELAKIFKEPEAKHSPDEVGSPLPFAYHEEILLPRKWDAVCIVSEFVIPNNLEQYIRPAHETEYWPAIEFDPAFVVDGKFPCGEPIPKHLRTGGLPPTVEKQKLASPPRVDKEDSRKRSLHHGTVEDDSDKRAAKRRRPSDARKKDSYVPKYRRSADRSRSRERRSTSRGSPTRSRRSSASSLNSLEAALLGISEDPQPPTEGRSPSPPPSHRRDDNSRSPQRKRRRPKTESAYSRRW